jgi:hypothetical protein
MKGRKLGLFVNLFGQFSCSWIRICIPNTDMDPDPGESNQCVSTTLVLALPEVELEQIGTGHHVERGGLAAVLQPHQGQAPGAADPGQQPDQLKKTTVA